MDMENRANVENAGDNGNGRTMAQRLEDNAPYNLFFSTIPTFSDTLKQKNSITFKDLLCPSLGDLKLSLQITFVVDVNWLLKQYIDMGQTKPLFLLYGKKNNDEGRQLPYTILERQVYMKTRFSTHHSKIGIYVYEDNSLRVVVSTANLISEDWNNYCQGLWISPLCRQLPEESQEDTSGESPTYFKSHLLSYLQQYNLPESSCVIKYVQRADFSAIRVFLVTSAPGIYKPTIPRHCHLFTVEHILSTYCSLPPTEDISWRINAQASSFGSLGPTPEHWLRGTFLRSLVRHNEPSSENSNATLNVIYPSQENVSNNSFGPIIGPHCLFYSQENRDKQQWLNSYLHSWKADRLSRSRAMPHIKTYCRISPCETKLAWFLLTSANISQAAWGEKITKRGTSYVRSYEVGVMFLPQFFGQDYFEIKSDGPEEKAFPFIYDLPLTPYREEDEPWIRVVRPHLLSFDTLNSQFPEGTFSLLKRKKPDKN